MYKPICFAGCDLLLSRKQIWNYICVAETNQCSIESSLHCHLEKCSIQRKYNVAYNEQVSAYDPDRSSYPDIKNRQVNDKCSITKVTHSNLLSEPEKLCTCMCPCIQGVYAYRNNFLYGKSPNIVHLIEILSTKK